MDLTFELTPVQIKDIELGANSRGAPFDEALASRFKGLAKERTTKRLRIKDIRRTDDGGAVGVVEILPDRTSNFGMIAGPLVGMASGIPSDSPVKVVLNGKPLDIDASRLELDDNVLTVFLDAGEAPPKSAADVVEAMKPRRGRPRKDA